MIGIDSDTIADFMGYEHRAVRRLVKKVQKGPVTSIPQGAALGAAVLLL